MEYEWYIHVVPMLYDSWLSQVPDVQAMLANEHQCTDQLLMLTRAPMFWPIAKLGFL